MSDDDRVIRLADKAPIKNDGVVQLARRILERAEAGEITALVAVAIQNDGQGWFASEVPAEDALSLLGALRFAETDMLMSMSADGDDE